MPFVDMVNPPLTTIRISHHAMGVQAAQLILQRLNQSAGADMEIRMKPELIVRASTVAPAAR
jgi:LacI family transcriptional regulator